MMQTLDLKSFMTHAVNSYTSNLLCVEFAHKCKKDIRAVFDTDIIHQTFEQYLHMHSTKFPTQITIIENLLSEHFEFIQHFQIEYNKLKYDIIHNYKEPTYNELYEINQKIQNFSKEWTQNTKYISLKNN